MSGSWVPVPGPDHGAVDGTRATLDPRLTGALIVSIVGVLVWLGMRTAAPWTAAQPGTILLFVGTLGGIGLLLLVSPRAAIALFLGLALVWRFVARPLWMLLGGVISSRTTYGFSGGDLIETYAPILVVAASLALAVWRRPPGRTTDGHPILATRVVNRLAAPAILVGPLLGLIAWQTLTPGDVYGRLLGAGVLVGGLGMLVFVGYSGFFRLGGRPAFAAILAAVWSVAVLSVFLLA